jgi:hypothetical protein
VWVLLNWDHDTGFHVFSSYLTYMFFGALQVVVLIYYSQRPYEDLKTCIVVPFSPVYNVWLCAARLVAITEEAFFRRSFDDNYVPPKVRAATIHW